MPTYNFAVVVDDRDMRDQPRLSRRRARQQHAVADQPLPRARGAAAGVRARARDPRRRRPEAVEAARRGQRHRLSRTRASCPRRWSTTWRASAGAMATRRSSVASSWSQWFDGSHLSKSPAQWDAGQARLGQRALPEGAATRANSVALAKAQLARRGLPPGDDGVLARAALLFRDRCSTGAELADWLAMIFGEVGAVGGRPRSTRHRAPCGRRSRPCARSSPPRPTGTSTAIAAAIKETLAAHGLKMPQLAPAVRVLVCGRAQTPSLDAVLALFPRDDRARAAGDR